MEIHHWDTNVYVLCILIVLALAIVVKVVALAICRPRRLRDLESYSSRLKRQWGCRDALKMYDDGVHIENHYGVSLGSVGYKSLSEFHEAAIASLQRALDHENREFASLCCESICRDNARSEIQKIERRTKMTAANERIVKMQDDLKILKSRYNRPRPQLKERDECQVGK